MIDPKLTKAVDAVSTSVIEIITNLPTFAGTGVTISKCVRDDADDISINGGNRANYFSSFGLPTSDTQITTTSTISLLYPELYQLNTDRFILINIGKGNFNEFIDGRSVSVSFYYNDFFIPRQVTLYSSTYTGDKASKYGESSPMLGDNIAYLFSDYFNRPYTGLTVNEMGEIISRSGVTSWNPTGQFKDRPGAISYREVQSEVSCINSDKRFNVYFSNAVEPGYPAQLGTCTSFNSPGDSGGFLIVYVNSTHSFRVGDKVTVTFDRFATYDITGTIGSLTNTSITFSDIGSSILYNGLTGAVYKGNDGAYYNYDIPLGFVSLDKGFIVITHKDLVNKFTLSTASNGFYQNGSLVNGSGDITYSKIYYTGTSLFNISYSTLKTEFKTSVSCSALLNEFYISNNTTWNRVVANSPFSNIPAVQITEAGFYNAFGELIGLSKFSEPIEKTQEDILSMDFTIDM